MKYLRLLMIALFFCVPFLSAGTIYVDGAATGADPNGSSSSPYTTIQAAIDNSIDDDEILVAEGTYGENLDMMGKEITLRSTNPSDPNVVAATIIDGGAAGSVITCNSGETANTVIAGFTIQNGNGNSNGYGGGIYCEGSNPVIEYCVLVNNDVTILGGGISCFVGAAAKIMNCSFFNNSAGFGGGVSCYQSDVTIIHSIFSSNTSTLHGGGIYSDQSSPSVIGCTFSGNSTSLGGAFYSDQGTPVVSNSIMWGNSATTSGSQIFSDAEVTYCAVEGGWGDAADNNIDHDPIFLDADGVDDIPGTIDDDLHIEPYSLCINRGDPNGNYLGLFDKDGDRRVRYQRIDIGAYEVYPIEGDLNADEGVELDDLILFTAERWLIDAALTDFAMFGVQWLYGTGPIAGDLNGDKQVDMDDLLLLVADDMWLVETNLYDFSQIAGQWLYGVD